MKFKIHILFILLTLSSCKYSHDYKSLEKKINTFLKSSEGEFAILFKNLSDGKTILINENEEFHAASTMKTPVMIEVFRNVPREQYH